MVLGILLLLLVGGIRVAHAHSWVACTDYRGSPNYFDQSACVSWPRNYRPDPAGFENGYQIAFPDSRAFAGQGCDVPMTSGSWRDAYNEAYPFAVYEAGEVYCLAWPMKNHGILPASCDEQQSKTDAGLDDVLHLFVSAVNPSADPTQAEFSSRNVNELAGLAQSCSTTNAERDECQLGLEKPTNGERDCKGFRRSPKYCENSGSAMGTGCFRVPSDLQEGHYVFQWSWTTSFIRPQAPGGLQRIPYKSCFDALVVSKGSTQARPGVPGTKGDPESGLPCSNNVMLFRTASPEPTPPPPPPPPPMPPTPTPDCAADGEECDGPQFEAPRCCAGGLTCSYWQDTKYARCREQQGQPAPPPSSSPPQPPPPLPPPPPEVSCTAREGEECDSPDWAHPRCCADGLACSYWRDTRYGRCQRQTIPAQDPCEGGVAHFNEHCDNPEWALPKCCAQGACVYWRDTRYARCQEE